MNAITNSAPVSDFIVTPDAAATAGAISYWRLGSTIDLPVLRAAWERAGLDTNLLPEEPSDKVGLSRALRDLESATRKAIKIRGGDFADGWGLVDIRTEDGNVRTVQVLRARKLVGSAVVDVAVETDYLYTEDFSAQINAGFRRACSQLAAPDVSIWLRNLAEGIDATSLRDKGGIYFIPRDAVGFWEKVTTVLAEVSRAECKVFRIPALQTAEAVEAILDSIEVEARDTIDAFEADLVAAAEPDGLGARALRTRQAQAEKLAGKLGKYEGLLGIKLDAIREKLETVSAGLTAARFAAEAAADAASVAAVKA